jgi:hypothetical protein
MSEQNPSADEPVVKAEIHFEVPPSPRGNYGYERQNGTVVHGDASGEWMVDEHGDAEDIVFFASPRWLAKDDR